METTRIQRALLSVSDKTGLDKFAKGLVAQNVQLISTGGTCRYLQELGLPVESTGLALPCGHTSRWIRKK